jgi:hypothetical protein
LKNLSTSRNESRQIADNESLTLQLNAGQLTDWRSLDGVADVVSQSPVRSDEPEKKIMLVPYAAAKLRSTAFPHLDKSAKAAGISAISRYDLIMKATWKEERKY